MVVGTPVQSTVGRPYVSSGIDKPFHFLVFGGSQGAQFFSSAVPAAIRLLPETLRSRLVLTQQARGEDEAQVRAAYEEIGLEAEVAPFFKDMPRRIADAHFVMSRSGASTVSEIAAIGRPAVLVPFPYALDHDQAANATALQAAGGAEVIRQAELSPERIAAILTDAMNEPERLAHIAERARSVGKPDATRLLADLAEVIASGKTVSEFKKGERP